MNRIAEKGIMESASAHARLAQLESDVRSLLKKLGPIGGVPEASIGPAAKIGHGGCLLPGDAARPPATRLHFTSAPDVSRSRLVAEDRSRARFVRELIRRRRRREQYLPADLFADPAWDMLLDLYAAHYEGRTVSVSSLCIAAAVPATTALRWIRTLTDMEAFIRVADPSDGRRIYVHLSDDMRRRLDQYFENYDD